MDKAVIRSVDGYELNLCIYRAENSKCTVQLMHGMEEYQGRYKDFAEYFVSRGYSVVTSDMRGHGASAPLLSYFGGGKSADALLIEDQRLITKYIREIGLGNRIVIYAHSMGTITARNLIRTDSKEYAAVILSGCPKPNPIAGVGIFLANVVGLFKGEKGKSKLLDSMSLGEFSRAIENAETDFDWLSFNKENVRDYMADPLCGVSFTVNAYRALFKLVKGLADKNTKDLNPDLPLLLLRGEGDPCIGGDKGFNATISALEAQGFTSLNVKYYENMRHDLINEAEYLSVYNDCDEFLNSAAK